MRKNMEMENNTMKVIYYTQTTGRIYAEGKWIANFRISNGNIVII